MNVLSLLAELVAFALLYLWPLSFPALCLLGWALARLHAVDAPLFAKSTNYCFSLLTIGPASLIACLIILQMVPPIHWHQCAGYLILCVLGLLVVLGPLFVCLATRGRLTCLLIVLGSSLLSLALVLSGATALSNAGT